MTIGQWAVSNILASNWEWNKVREMNSFVPFVLYMKVRNRHECHWKSMVTGLSNPLDHNMPFEFESDNETAEVEIDL
jgi:hypothetical protein